MTGRTVGFNCTVQQPVVLSVGQANMSNKMPIHYPVSLQLQQLYCMDDDDDDDDDDDVMMTTVMTTIHGLFFSAIS